AKDVAAKEVVRISLIDGPLHHAVAGAIFVAEVDVGGTGARGIAGQDDPLQKLVRVFLHENPVVEGSWLALVAINAEVNRTRMVLGQKGPFDAAGEAGTAPPAQSRILDRLDDLLAGHLVDGLGEGAVAAVGTVRVNGLAVRFADSA